MQNFIIQLITLGIGGLFIGLAIDDFKREKYISFGWWLLMGLDIWILGLVARIGLALV